MTTRGGSEPRTPCILEISDKGIKMVDKSKPGVSKDTLIHFHQPSVHLTYAHAPSCLDFI